MPDGVGFVTLTRAVFAPGQRQAGLALLRELVELGQGEPGTLIQAFHEDAADPDVIWAYEMWASAEALDAHRANGSALRTRFADVFDGGFDVHVCTPLFAKGIDFSAVGAEQGGIEP